MQPENSNFTNGKIKREADGPLWVEYLAGLMEDANLYDFARSGATANNKLILRYTEDLNAQVNRYLRSEASAEPKNDSLFTIWIGVNDMTVLFKKHPVDTVKRQSIINGVVNTVRYDMEKLRAIGATNILLLGLIPLENLPLYRDLPLEEKHQLEKLVSEYNMKLVEIMDHFKTDNPHPYLVGFPTSFFKNPC
ncbi:hypothetical protein BD408DRAFT_405093 [Parasitella parasitica]|nr:hypothetical protein BD408DRAFT_405093 [Parasitella parasitica]